MNLHLQFIRRRIVPWWGLAFMVTAAIVASIVLQIWYKQYQANQVGAAHLMQMQSKLKEQGRLLKQRRDSMTPQEFQRIKDHAKIITALNYPWNQVLGEIEQTQEQGVAVLAFAHDQASGTSQLTVEALDTPSIIRYVRKINGDAGQGHWYIASYQTQSQSVPPTVKANLVSQ